MTSDGMVAETATRMFRDLCDPATVNRAKDDAWKAPAWAALEDAGLTLAWVPDTLGGAGADVADGFAVLRETGRFAVPLPVAETLLAGWLLAQAGIASPKGAMACGPAREGDRLTLANNGTLSGRLRAVPFAKAAGHLAVLAERAGGGSVVALVAAGAARIADGTSIAGDALNAVSFEGVRPIAVKDAPAGLDANALLLMGAAARAMQMAGALQAILDLTVATPMSASPSSGRSPSSRRCSTTWRGWPVRLRPRSPQRARRRIRLPMPTRSTRWCSSRPPPPRSASARRPAKAQPLPTRCSAPSALHVSTRCTASPSGCGPGATTSATRANGR